MKKITFNNDLFDETRESSGNATDPIPIIDKFKPSGLRWWSTGTTLGNDIKIDENSMKMGWRIQNKFENAKKFIQMQIDNGWIGQNPDLLLEERKYEILKDFEDLNIDKASDKIYKFFWNEFCDKWIEDSKKNSTSLTLNYIINDFESILKIII